MTALVVAAVLASMSFVAALVFYVVVRIERAMVGGRP